MPLQSEFFALEGLSQLMLTIREVRQTANPALRIEGVALTMVDRRTSLAQQVEDDARANLGDLVFQTVIPRNVRLSEAPVPRAVRPRLRPRLGRRERLPRARGRTPGPRVAEAHGRETPPKRGLGRGLSALMADLGTDLAAEAEPRRARAAARPTA